MTTHKVERETTDCDPEWHSELFWRAQHLAPCHGNAINRSLKWETKTLTPSKLCG